MTRALRVIGGSIGIFVALWAFVLGYWDISQSKSVTAPLLLAALAVFLIWSGRESKIMPPGPYNRIQAYLNATPKAKWLWRLSHWSGWLAIPLIFAWIWLALNNFPELGGWIVLIGFLFIVPSLVLSVVVLRGYVRAARTLVKNDK